MRAVLDTSAVLAPRERLEAIVEDGCAYAISAATLGELEHGLLAAGTDWDMRFRRDLVMRRIHRTFRVLPIDAATARAYAQLCFVVRRAGRSHRSRTADLLIAATAMAHELPLLTANPDDLRGAEWLVDIVAV